MNEYKLAEVKWDGGKGALLCNGCNTILATGHIHDDIQHFCPECQQRKVFYHGCWSENRLGHHLFDIHGMTQPTYGDKSPIPSFGKNLDCGHLPSKTGEEGKAYMVHENGWTILSFCDRSADKRGGSNSTFVIEGTCNAFEDAFAFAKNRFPTIWARYPFTVEAAD